MVEQEAPIFLGGWDTAMTCGVLGGVGLWDPQEMWVAGRESTVGGFFGGFCFVFAALETRLEVWVLGNRELQLLF